MGKMGVNRTAGTPDSLSDNESSPYSRTPVRKASTPTIRKSVAGLTGSLPASRPASRPQSRPGSKPPSRHGSNLSLDSTGECIHIYYLIYCIRSRIVYINVENFYSIFSGIQMGRFKLLLSITGIKQMQEPT